MPGDSGSDPSGEGSRREFWVKLILLSSALVLVVAYALIQTYLGALATDVARTLLRHGGAVAMLAGLAATAAGAAIVFFRRRAAGLRFIADRASEAPRLAGREQFRATLAAQLESHAKSGRQLALHLIDIDRFSAINAVLGEAEGDAFLDSVAGRLSVLVEQPERLARIGDDEFVVLQPETGGARHAEIFARRIQDTLKDVSAQVARQARPSASIGVAVSPEHGHEPMRLLRSAGLALRAAKQAGGNAMRVYAREMEMTADARLQTEKAIGDGLHQGWFALHFQPQYDLRTRRLTGFEALVRMNHPELGELLPDAFLPVAEESGLMQPLGDWITREALTAAAGWPPHLMLSLNVSAAQLRNGDVAANILKALAKAAFEGSRLRVEIPEAALLEKAPSVQDQLRRLKRSGALIVVDDFGVAGSSLTSLARSPCDAVKLDRTFVQRVGEEPEIENFVRSLIGAARAFDLAIFAEGVERPEQAHFLMANDCHNVQGFLFGRPVAQSELAAIIAKDMRNAMPGAGAARSVAAVAAA